jgi:Domain of unknown function (DUF4336)
MLEGIGKDIWTCAAPLSLLGMNLGTRMTVIRLESGQLLLHSVIPHSAALQAEVEKLGTVAWIVAPSSMHHLFVGPWQQAFPAAKMLAAPGVAEKRKDLRLDGVLDGSDPGWGSELKTQLIPGMPSVNEVLFLHVPSRTLICTDALFYLPNRSGFTSFYAWFAGVNQKAGQTPVFKMMIKDKAAYKASWPTVLAWDFEQISLCHGDLVPQQGKKVLTDALAWL